MKKNPDVDQFLAEKDHPRTPEIERVREIILATDERIEETIKWRSPTFVYKGNIASFFMNAKKFVSLMFHKGAFITEFKYGGNRSIIFNKEDAVPVEELKDCIAMVLTYHLRKKAKKRKK